MQVSFGALCYLLILVESQSNLPKPVITQIDTSARPVTIYWRVSYSGMISHFEITYTDGERQFRRRAEPTERQAVLPLVQPCTHYTARVRYRANNRYSPDSAEMPFKGSQIQIPPPPTDVLLKIVNFERIISWTLVAPNFEVSKYTVTGEELGGEIIKRSVPSDVNYLSLTDFHFEHNYNVSVTADNFCGSSEASEPIEVLEVAVPEPPEILSISSTVNSITINLATPADGVEYRANYSTPSGYVQKNFNAGGTETLRQGIQPCFLHEIYLYARSVAGESEATIIHAYASSNEIPDTPEIINITTSGRQHIAHWRVSSRRPLVGHIIEYTTNTGEYFVTHAPGGARTTTLKDMIGCRHYDVRVRSENECGWSSDSPPFSYEAPPTEGPSAPLAVKATENETALHVAWPIADPQEWITEYDLLVVDDTGFSRSFYVPGQARSFNVDGADMQTTQHVSVFAKNACGWSKPIVTRFVPVA
ncbi:hypothetical protein CSKR_112241 [Clonorchis sinensis]|uniref:Fibronectin type-III domain-containing protein n=1 Tax=Clonorchis sinensis TaxID=79923 RepID=A0A3R7F1X1_CLOSI|nr:hypothetical protein CSKR_112241 [Clonorchis sinensis]